jgi:hypothetical protein
MTTLVTQNTIESTLFNSLATISGSQPMSNKTLKVFKETATITNTAATGTLNFDVATQAISVYNTATGNFNVAVRANSAGANLNSVLSVGESIGICLIVPNSSTAYFLTGISIDSVAQTVRYQSGIGFTAGNPNATDMYNILIIKTGTVSGSTGTYLVYASQTKFA